MPYEAYNYTPKEQKAPKTTLKNLKWLLNKLYTVALKTSDLEEKERLLNEVSDLYASKMQHINQITSGRFINNDNSSTVLAIKVEITKLGDLIKEAKKEMMQAKEEQQEQKLEEKPEKFDIDIKELEKDMAEFEKAMDEKIEKFDQIIQKLDENEEQEYKEKPQEQPQQEQSKENQQEEPSQTMDRSLQEVEQIDIDKELGIEQPKKETPIKNPIEKVDQILLAFLKKIDGIGKNFPEAGKTAEELYKSLLKTRNIYAHYLKDNLNENDAAKIFKENCETAINKAMPILKRDLGWGEYLKNLLKAVVNAVHFVVTAGKKGDFLPYAKSTISEFATKTKDKLKAHDQEEENQQAPSTSNR